MNTMNVCKYCSAQLQAGLKYCDACGLFLDTRKENSTNVECEAHPDHRAVGICVVCSKPVCTDCEVKSAGKILCDDPEHKIVLQDWRLMLLPDSEFEAKALVRNLADNGIMAKTYSLHDHAATYWLNDNRVLLFVKKSEEEKARTLLQELNLVRND